MASTSHTLTPFQVDTRESRTRQLADGAFFTVWDSAVALDAAPDTLAAIWSSLNLALSNALHEDLSTYL